MRERVDVGLNPLENVGNPVDGRIENPGEHLLAARTGQAVPTRFRCEMTKGRRLRIAQGQQAMAGENEGDGNDLRHGRIGLRHHGRRHVDGVVFHIEPARDLDFLHVLFGRHIEAELDVDEGHFLFGRVQEVDPYSLRRITDPGSTGMGVKVPLTGT